MTFSIGLRTAGSASCLKREIIYAIKQLSLILVIYHPLSYPYMNKYPILLYVKQFYPFDACDCMCRWFDACK